MKQLLIIGARGWGREIYNMLPWFIGYGTEFEVKGFLDDKSDALDGMSGYPPIIGSVEKYEIESDDVFVCALGDAHWKRHYAEIILGKGGRFINLIHKECPIGKNTKMGQGCVVCDHVGISCDISIGDFVTFQPYAIVGHDCQIGNYSHIGTRSFMGGYSIIGEASTLHTNSVVLPHVRVGNGSVVGAGAVVMRKVKNGDTVYGNPATVLKI